jgi:hypothetical protein
MLTEGQDPRPQRAERRRAAQTSKPPKAIDESFAGIAEQFIQRYEDRKLRRGAEVVSLIRRELIGFWGHRRFADIKHRDVLEVIEAIVDRRKATPDGGSKRRTGGPYAARHTFAACQVLFRWAFSRELIALDPTARIKGKDLHGLDQSTLQRDRVLTDDELRVVWTAAEQTSYPFGPR